MNGWILFIGQVAQVLFLSRWYKIENRTTDTPPFFANPSTEVKKAFHNSPHVLFFQKQKKNKLNVPFNILNTL